MPIVFDEQGLHIQTQTEIRDETFDELDAAVGVAFHRNPAEDPFAQVVETLAEQEALTQQALLALSRSFDRDGAIGVPLNARAGLTGTVRKGGLSSYVNGLLTFTGAATVPNGARYLHVATNTQWQVTDGPHTRADAGTLDAQLAAVEVGPTEAAVDSTWSAITVIANVTGFTNPTEDATPGRLRESDVALQRRSKRELYAQGRGPLRAIEGAVLRAEGTGIVTARAYHNTSTYPVDADGIPFKAVNLVVETSPSTPTDAQKQAILDALWTALGGGGEAYGTDVTGTVTDSEGVAQPVAFDLVEVLDIELEIDLTTSTSELATSPNLDDVVKAAVLELAVAEHQTAGRDVLAGDYSGLVFSMQRAGTIAGVDSVAVRMSISPASPAEVAKLPVGIRQRAAFAAGRIAVATV